MTILTTKLHIPPTSGSLIPRSQLLARLDEALDYSSRLTLITAPAGFGKTTLLTTWLATRLDKRRDNDAEHVAWVSLGESENDPAQFLAYVVTALDAGFSGLGQEVLPLLHAPQPPQLDTLFTALINQIDDTPTPTRTLLVLDDYHVIHNPVIHDGLSFLLDHLPPALHVILTSRTEPALPLARYRARNQIIELHNNDLRFTVDEISDFFRKRAGVQLGENDALLLAERTEGWAAALQFATLSLQGVSRKLTIEQLIKSLSGRNRQIVDYLLAEVLEQQPPAVQQFLLRTSILARFNADLCSYVIGEANAQSVLDMLERTNLFTIALDDERRWYRYHHLFAELLRDRLSQQVAPEAVEALHITASRWFEGKGFIDEAIDHALTVQDEDRVATLLQVQLQDLLWGQGMISRLWHRLDQLSDQTLLAHPQLVVAGCYSHILGLNVDQLTRYLSILEQIADLPPELYAQFLVIRATVLEAQGEVAEGERLAREALAMLPDCAPETKALVLFFAHILLERNQPWTTVRPWMVEALDAAKRCNNNYIVGYVMTFLVWIALARGERHHAIELCYEALELAKSKGDKCCPQPALPTLAWVTFMRNGMRWSRPCSITKRP